MLLDGSILRLSGPLTFSSVSPLLRALEVLLPRLPRQLTVDLAGLTRADSAGLALLVELWRRQRLAQGEVVFVDAPTLVQPLIALYGLDDVLAL